VVKTIMSRSVFQAMTRTKEKGRGIPSGHAAPVRQSACRVAECGGQRYAERASRLSRRKEIEKIGCFRAK
jgi:hypothetical protein